MRPKTVLNVGGPGLRAFPLGRPANLIFWKFSCQFRPDSVFSGLSLAQKFIYRGGGGHFLPIFSIFVVLDPMPILIQQTAVYPQGEYL